MMFLLVFSCQPFSGQCLAALQSSTTEKIQELSLQVEMSVCQGCTKSHFIQSNKRIIVLSDPFDVLLIDSYG